MSRVIPYGRQSIDEQDIQAVVDVLRSDWLTSGPVVTQFEDTVREYIGVRHAIAVSNGTAALHLALVEAGIGALVGGVIAHHDTGWLREVPVA